MVQDSGVLDCLIIGGGPAGLTAAVYLARFRRNIMVVHHQNSRAALIPCSHNYPGFKSGIGGVEFLKAISAQVRKYGALITEGEITFLRKSENGVFVAEGQDITIKASTVLLATGVIDEKPELPGIDDFIYSGIVRFCPICDGYEAINKHVGILGHAEMVIPKALFLRTYTPHITLLVTDGNFDALRNSALLRDSQISVPGCGVSKITMLENGLQAVMADGKVFDLDILYPALGSQPRSSLAVMAGAALNDQKYIITDSQQCTSVPGLYAAGDVTFDLSQIAVGTGQAVVAATAIHNGLPRNIP